MALHTIFPEACEITRHRDPVNGTLKRTAVGPERQLDVWIR